MGEMMKNSESVSIGLCSLFVRLALWTQQRSYDVFIILPRKVFVKLYRRAFFDELRIFEKRRSPRRVLHVRASGGGYEGR